MIQIDQVIKQISPLLQPLMYVGISMSLYYEALGIAEAQDSIIRAGSSSERKPELPGPERTPQLPAGLGYTISCSLSLLQPHLTGNTNEGRLHIFPT